MAQTLQKDAVREIIARRVAKEMRNGDFVNLGIGLPTMVPQFLPEGVEVILQAENGIVSVGAPPAEVSPSSRYVVNPGGRPASCLAGGVFLDSAMSFALIRGGHVDVTVLGALQVDVLGNLANWIIPGKMVAGMGGAMDLVVGARRVIVAMQHTQHGTPKIVESCSLPLTAARCVDLIVTEMGVFGYTEDGLILTEINPAFTLEEVQNSTGASFAVSESLAPMM